MTNRGNADGGDFNQLVPAVPLFALTGYATLEDEGNTRIADRHRSVCLAEETTGL